MFRPRHRSRVPGNARRPEPSLRLFPFRPRPVQTDRTGGFTLLEVIVSITLITVVTAALTTLFVRTLSSVNYLRSAQSAAAVTTAAIDHARSVGAAAAVAGRGGSDVSAQFASFAGTPVQPWLDGMDQAAAPAPSADPDLPTTPVVQTVGGVDYSVSYLVGTCRRVSSDDQASQNCTNGSDSPDVSYVRYVRVVVAVTWPDASCDSGTCYRIGATLLNGDADPMFNFNTEPPPMPNLSACKNQAVAVGDQVDLPVFGSAPAGEPQPICTLSGGVPSFTWSADALPSGLLLNQDAHITGTVDGAAGTVRTRITVRDAFLRQATGNQFTWTVLPRLALGPVVDQVATKGKGITPFTLVATGGSGSNYRYAATGLPTGISLGSTTGTFTGAPSAAGSFGVTVTVTDGSGKRTAEGSFTWRVYEALTPPALPDVNLTLGTALNLPLPLTGGSGNYTMSATGLPTGTTLTGDSAAGYRITGTPTGTGVYPVTLTVSDTAANQTTSASFSIRVYAKPVITNPGDQRATVGQQVSLQLTATCPNSGCTYSATNLPGWLSLGRSSGTITGRAPGSPSVTSGITITATDAGGASATTAPFTWRVVDGPSITNPGDQQSEVGQGISLQIAGTCSSVGPCTYKLTNKPAWLQINQASGLITGTAPAAPTTIAGITVTITDKQIPAQSASATFNWNVVGGLSLTIPDQITILGDSPKDTVDLSLGAMASGGTAPLTYRVVSGSLPSGVTLASTGRMSGTPNAAGVKGPITVEVRDATGATARATFTWYVLSFHLADRATAPSATSGGWQGECQYDNGASLDLSAGLAGAGSRTVSYSVSTNASWASFDNQHTLSVAAPCETTGTSISVTVTDDGTGRTATTQFTWLITGGTIESSSYGGYCLTRGSSWTVTLSDSCGTTWSMPGDGTIRTTYSGSERCLTDANVGDPPTLASCAAGNAAQQFSIGSDGRITAIASGNVLDANRTGSRRNGYTYSVQMATADDSDSSQQWTFR